MELLETTFKFKHKDAGEITATILAPGTIPGYRDVWIVRTSKSSTYVPEPRGRQFINQTRARQIIASVLLKPVKP